MLSLPRGRENSGAAATRRTTTTFVAEELFRVQRRETALLLSMAETEEWKCSYYRSRLLLLSVAGCCWKEGLSLLLRIEEKMSPVAIAMVEE